MDLRDLSTNDIDFLIEQFIHNEVHRKILRRRLIDHVKFEALAEEFNYSVRHIKRIVYKNQDILYSRIESANFKADFSFALREVLLCQTLILYPLILLRQLKMLKIRLLT